MATKQKTNQSKPTIVESCEGILAVLKASQRQLEYLAHEHLEFAQILRLEQGIRVGGSPERAEIQRMHLLLDARLDHVRQLRAISSVAPLSFLPSDQARIEQLRKIQVPLEMEIPAEAKLETPVEAKLETPVEAKLETPVEAKTETPVEAKLETPVEAKTETPVEAKTEKESTPIPEHLPVRAQPKVSIEPVVLEAPGAKPKEIREAIVQPKVAKQERSIALSAAPIALAGHTDASSSKAGLSIQITPASPKELVAKDPNPIAESKKNLLGMATKAHGEGQLEEAIEAYTDLLDEDSTQATVLLARGRCYLEKKDYSAALSDFKRAQKNGPKDPDPWVALGDLHFARKKHAQAIEAFDQAIALESNHAQARCRRGTAHYHTGLYRQAFLDLQRAYKLDPEIPNIRRLVQLAIRKLEETS
jgi:TolA-binding protein